MADTIDVIIPDIGGAADVDVIEVLVTIGDEIELDTPLITLESDKASMEIPSSHAGKVEKLLVKVGDKVAEGDAILTLALSTSAEDSKKDTSHVVEKKTLDKAPEPKIEEFLDAPKAEVIEKPLASISSNIYAGPAVRRIAREFGVDLNQVQGSGRKSRITKEDVQRYVKDKLSQVSSGGINVSPMPKVDFSKFGETQTKPLNKIKKLTGEHTHRAWVTIPHVTQFDEVDITALEVFRKAEAIKAKEQGYKLTILAFVVKALGKALQEFPQFNASLDGSNLIFKKYVNIGVAVDTPNGLVVPVIRGVDKLSVSEIARDMARLSAKARESRLSIADMSGGCITISSLGGIGGTAFTPVVNAPEVAILGLSRASLKPLYIDHELQPRLILPLSLSYDHRVIDGAEAARFSRFLAQCISDIRKVIM